MPVASSAFRQTEESVCPISSSFSALLTGGLPLRLLRSLVGGDLMSLDGGGSLGVIRRGGGGLLGMLDVKFLSKEG